MIRKSNFSLVELLVVISIIAVLMGILIPAVNSMKERSRQTKARSEINSLLLAIKNYESTYGILPLTTAANNTDQFTSTTNTDLRLDDTSAANITAYDRLIQWLTQAPTQSGGAVDMTGNLRRIKFLDPAAADGSKTYLDPWGNRYIIIMNANYNEGVSIDSTATSPTYRLYSSVVIYSKGRNRIDDGGKNKAQDGSNNTDDISSWHK